MSESIWALCKKEETITCHAATDAGTFVWRGLRALALCRARIWGEGGLRTREEPQPSEEWPVGSAAAAEQRVVQGIQARPHLHQ